MHTQVNDTIVYDIASGKVTEHIKFDLGQVAMVVGGKNRGRVGTVISREKHKGSFDIGIVRDAAGVEFATRCASAVGHKHVCTARGCLHGCLLVLDVTRLGPW